MCKCKYNVIYCQQATLYVSYTNIALKYANMQNYAKVCQFFTKTAAMHIKKYDTVKILKIGTPEIITIIVLQLEQLDFTVQYCV